MIHDPYTKIVIQKNQKLLNRSSKPHFVLFVMLIYSRFVWFFSFFVFCINRISDGFPDPRTCLLHQKLQMLNVCINRRRVREGNLSGAMLKSNQQNMDGRSDESDDEFFDCDATNDDDAQTKYEDWNKPEGRMSKLNDMKLIDSDEFLYVPITQEPVPKTEDQLEDDAEILLKLGPDSGERIWLIRTSVLHFSLFFTILYFFRTFCS